MTLLREALDRRKQFEVEKEESKRRQQELVNRYVETQNEEGMLFSEACDVLERFGTKKPNRADTSNRFTRLAFMAMLRLGYWPTLIKAKKAKMTFKEYMGNTELTTGLPVNDSDETVTVEISCDTVYPLKTSRLSIQVYGLPETLYFNDKTSRMYGRNSSTKLEDFKNYRQVVGLVRTHHEGLLADRR